MIISLFASVALATGLPVRPVLECVGTSGHGAYTALFGYKNENAASVSIPVGANNKFTPTPIDRGQTTLFAPGRIVGAFHVPFDGSNLAWTLQGPDGSRRTATASSKSARCKPTAVNDTASTSQGVSVTIAVLANDSDRLGLPLTVIGVSQPVNGAAAVTAGMTVTYDPNHGFAGIDSFHYTVSNGSDTSTATVTVSVHAATNDPPNAHAGPDQNVAVGTLVTLDGSASTDPDGSPHPLSFLWRFAIVPHASLLTDADIAHHTSAAPSFTPDVVGTYVLTLQVSDGDLTDDDHVEVVASVPNVAPNADAGPDQNVLTGTVVTLDGTGSHDPDGQPHPLTFRWTFSLLPSGSTLTDGSISDPTSVAPSFTPDTAGTYVLSLDVSDGDLTDTDQVAITAAVPNVPPNADAGPDQNARTRRTVTLDGSGSNDPDSGPSPLSFLWTFVSVPPGSTLANGSIMAADTNSASFTPDVDGTYVVNLRVSDGDLADSDQVMVIAANTAPVAVDDSYAVDEEMLLIVGAQAGVLGNDSDTDGDLLSAVLVGSTTRGALTLNSDGAFSYTPETNFSGPDSFTYRANDGDLDGNVVTVTITVNHLNDPPVANAGPDQVITVGETVQLLGAGSIDPDGDPLSYQWTLTSVPAGSAAVLSNPAAVNPTVTPDVVGPYVVALVVNDGTVNSPADSVSITASAPPNRAPQALGDAYEMEQGGVLAVSAAGGVLANDTDPDGNALSAVLVSGTSNGVLTLNSTGALSYVPELSFTGTDSLIYRASDGSLDSTGTVVISVSPSETSVFNLAITSPLDGAAVSSPTIDVEGTVTDVSAYVDVNGVEAQVFPDGRFVAPRVRLYRGVNQVTAQATNPAGASDVEVISVSYEIPAAPLGITLLAPEDGALIESPLFTVTGIVSDPTATVLVNDTVAQLDENQFTATIYACQDQGPTPTAYVLMAQASEGGSCTITVTGYTNNGQSAISTIAHTYVPSETPLVVMIENPARDAVLTASPVEVTGRITDVLSGISPTEVMVNGVPATVEGDTFAALVPLTDGINYVTVHARNYVGDDAYDALRFVYEPPSRPLTIVISAPIDGAVVNRPEIPVSGVISDSSATVEINGVAANSDFRSFRLDAIALSIGENILAATAVRPTGETATATVRITYDPAYPAPPAPILQNLPQYATTTVLDLSGLTLPLYAAQIMVNGVSQTVVTADSTGLFKAAVRLYTEGPNHIVARAIDASGNVSPPSSEAVVIRDTVKPYANLIVHPEDDLAHVALAVSRVPIRGVTEPLAQVDLVIDDDPDYRYTVNADERGYFEVVSHLSAGLHSVRAGSTDPAGNTAVSGRTVLVQRLNWASVLLAYSAVPLAPVLDPVPNPIAETSVDVEGHAYAGFSVEVYRNNELIDTVPVNSRGRYRLAGVSFVPGRNILRVRQVERQLTVPGFPQVVIQAADSAETAVDVTAGSPTRPQVTLDFPTEGAVTDADFLPLRGAVDATATISAERNLYYLCCGFRVQDGRFVGNHLIPLLPGENLLAVEVSAPDGSREVRKVRVFSRRGAPVPAVAITSPVDGEEVVDQFISVIGMVGDGVGTVIVDKVEAALSGNNVVSGTLDVIDLYRHPSGLPTVMAWAQDATGTIGHADVQLRYRYVPAPQVFITVPSEGEVLGSSPITVTGEAYDASEVTVNGVLARLDGAIFTAQIDLQEGSNVITVVATNAGKAAVTRTEVTYASGVTLQSLRLEPASGVVPLGGTLAFAAMGEYSNGGAVDLTRQAVWTSSDPSVATVTSNGVVTGRARGAITLTATSGGFVATRSLGVGEPALQAIVVGYAWGTDFLTTGVPSLTLGETLRFKAFGVMSDETLLDISARVTWTTSAPTVATVDASGLATAIGRDSTEITASYQSKTGSRTLTVIPPPMYLFITSPSDGASVNRSETTVSGTVISSAAEVGVVVNGVVASVVGTQFGANGVELVDGSNVITASAIDSNGAVAEDRVIVVAATTGPEITLRADIEAGIAPLEVTLQIESTFGAVLTSTLSASGPGAAEITALSPSEYRVALPSEGLYSFTAQVTDGQGNIYTDDLVIVAVSRADVEALLVGKWAAMQARLLSGDLDGAMTYFSGRSQERYRAILPQIQALVPQAFGSLEEIHLLLVRNDQAEMEAIKTEGGIRYSYPIVFIRDETGTWKLWGF